VEGRHLIRTNRKNLFAIFALGVFYASCAGAPGENASGAVAVESAAFNESGLNDIQAMMNAAVENERIPSAIAMLAREGEIAWLVTAGDMGPDIPMSRDAIIPLASIGKMYTAAAAMILLERGAIALDDPVSKFIPEFADVKINVADAGAPPKLSAPETAIMVRHLLTHTSGLVVDGDEFWSIWGANIDTTTTTHLSRDLAALPLEYQPGQRFKYGPTGAAYEVLGAVIEIASGQTLEDFMTENIFRPLGLKDSYFFIPEEKENRLPAFYSRRNGPMEPSRPYAQEYPRSTYFFGGGGISASPDDILRFTRLFTELGEVDGVRILKADTVKMMMSDQLGDLAPQSWKERERSWGFGASVTYANGEPRTGSPEQYGWAGGGYARLWVMPEKKIAAYFAFPLEPPGDDDLLSEFERLVYASIEE